MIDIIIESVDIFYIISLLVGVISTIVVGVAVYRRGSSKTDKANENEINLLICKINTVYKEVYHIVRHSGRDNDEIFAIDCELRDYYRSSNKNIVQLIEDCRNKITISVFMNRSYNSSKIDLEKSVEHLVWLHDRFTPSFEELDMDDIESQSIMWLDLLDEFEKRKQKLYSFLEKKQIV